MEELSPPIISEPISKTEAEYGKYIPQCYTDFGPHFNTKYTLTEVIVGTHNDWFRSPGSPEKLVENAAYGYLDIRPGYIVNIIFFFFF